MKSKVVYLPLFILSVGIAFTLYLQLQIPDGAFFSGDAGLKALLAQQLSQGTIQFDLLPPDVPWVKSLWEQGLYPYEEPFVYHINNRYYITFPYSFPLITAPFHRLLGYRGLYLIPLVTTWGIWLLVYRFCQRLQFKALMSSLALIMLIFASPLTVYSAMYWEHTLSVFLILAGLEWMAMAKSSPKLTPLWLILSGFCLGFSVWFRPESLCAIALIFFLVYLPDFLKLTPLINLKSQLSFEIFNFSFDKKLLLLIITILTIILFFGSNQLIYGHYLGIHAIQVIEEDTSIVDKLREAWSNFRLLSQAFLIFFPMAGFLIFDSIVSFLKPKSLVFKLPQITIYLACLGFIAGVSLIVPSGTAGLIPGGKQWGTRFLLTIIPLVTLAVIHAFNLIQANDNKWLKNLSLLVFTALLVTSIYTNTYAATLYLQDTYQKLAPTLTQLSQDTHQIIVMSHQFVGQVLEPVLDQDKLLFKVDKVSDLKVLSRQLLKHNYQTFLYICYPHRPCKLPETSRNKLIFQAQGQGFKIHFQPIDTTGRYPMYSVSLQQL